MTIQGRVLKRSRSGAGAFAPLRALVLGLLLGSSAVSLAHAQDGASGLRTYASPRRDFASTHKFLSSNRQWGRIAAVGRVDSVETWLSPVHEMSGQRISVTHVKVLTPILGCTLDETIRIIMETAIWWDEGRLLAVYAVCEPGPLIRTGDVALIMGYPADNLGSNPYGDDPHLSGAHILLSAGLLTDDFEDLTQFPRIPTRLTLDAAGRAAMRENASGGDLLQYLNRAEVSDSLTLGEMIARLLELRKVDAGSGE